MIWYLAIATILFCGYFSKQPKRYYTASLIILFIFTGFRDVTLGDYNNVALEKSKNIENIDTYIENMYIMYKKIAKGRK